MGATEGQNSEYYRIALGACAVGAAEGQNDEYYWIFEWFGREGPWLPRARERRDRRRLKLWFGEIKMIILEGLGGAMAGCAQTQAAVIIWGNKYEYFIIRYDIEIEFIMPWTGWSVYYFVEQKVREVG